MLVYDRRYYFEVFKLYFIFRRGGGGGYWVSSISAFEKIDDGFSIQVSDFLLQEMLDAFGDVH